MLFTCAVTCAVHLELVSEMSTEMFLLAFKRFIYRGSLCRTVYSDNACTFKCADQDPKNLWEGAGALEIFNRKEHLMEVHCRMSCLVRSVKRMFKIKLLSYFY